MQCDGIERRVHDILEFLFVTLGSPPLVTSDVADLARVTAQVLHPRLNGLDQSKVVRVLGQTPSRDTSKSSCRNNIPELLLDEVSSLKAPEEWPL